MRAYQRVETRYERAEVLGGDCRVLHDRDRLRVRADAHQEAQAGLPHPPQTHLLARVQEGDAGVCAAITHHGRADRIECRAHGGSVVTVDLDQQERARLPLHEVDERCVADAVAAAADDRVVDEFDGGGDIRQRFRGGVTRCLH